MVEVLRIEGARGENAENINSAFERLPGEMASPVWKSRWEGAYLYLSSIGKWVVSDYEAMVQKMYSGIACSDKGEEGALPTENKTWKVLCAEGKWETQKLKVADPLWRCGLGLASALYPGECEQVRTERTVGGSVDLAFLSVLMDRDGPGWHYI